MIFGMSPVLLIDDDVELVGLFADYLRREGFPVGYAHDGEAGARAALSGDYAIAVLDVLMPGMNGVEMVEKAREIYPDLPVVLATGYADMNVVEKVIPANRVLRKPFRIEDLISAVSDAMTEPLAA